MPVAISAHAEPVYLECARSDNKDYPSFVKLDEATGKITHTEDWGKAYNVEGFFSAKTISYKTTNVLESIGKAVGSNEYTIDRVTLKFTGKNTTFLSGITELFKGQCKIARVKDRKI